MTNRDIPGAAARPRRCGRVFDHVDPDRPSALTGSRSFRASRWRASGCWPVG